MFSLLTDLEVNILVGAVALIVGVLCSTEITDFFKGVPSDLRTALNDVEADAVAKVKAAKAVKAIPAKKAVSPAAAIVASAAAAVAAVPVPAVSGVTGPTGA